MSHSDHPPLCEWQDLTSGARICTETATYLATYDDCQVCPTSRCVGAGICVEHAATERARAEVVGLLELRLLTGVPTP